MENRNYVAIPSDVKAKIIAMANGMAELITPYCVILTATERKEMSKMGNVNTAFVTQAFDEAVQNPGFLPSYVNTDEWRIDTDDVKSTEQMITALAAVNQKLSDTRMQAGHEALQSGHAYYYNVKRAASDGIAGAKPSYEKLKSHFKSKGIRYNNKKSE